jgi:hypothetical protein
MHDHTKENEVRAQQKLPPLYCPFGCTGPECDPNPTGGAYCCHLVGFTVDESERIFEPLGNAIWNQEFFAVGRKRQKVAKGDVVINPLVMQKLPSGIHYSKKWVSARVYRPCTQEQAEAWRKRYAKPQDYEIMQEIAEEDKDRKIKELETELAALKGAPVEQPVEAVPDEAPVWGPPQPGNLDPSDEELDKLTAPVGVK